MGKVKEYTQIFRGKYNSNGAVQAMDVLNDKPLTKDYFKTRPDMKQRIEKAINTGTYLQKKTLNKQWQQNHL